MPADEAATVGERAVCGVCKPVFLQRIMDGEPDAPAPMEMGVRELGFWETVRTGWRILRQDWLALLGVKLLVAVPAEYLLLQLPAIDEETLAGVGRSFRREQLIESLLGVIATLAVAWLVRERIEGRRPSLPAALGHSARRWPVAVLTGWLEGIVTVLLMLLLIVPGVIYAGYFTFTTIVVSLRGCAGTRALDYSRRLVKGRWWRVVGYSLGFALPMIVVALVVGFLDEELAPHPGAVLAGNVAISVALLFPTVCLTVLFLNLDAVAKARESVGEKALGR